MGVYNMAENSVIWGYILIGGGRPSRPAQRKLMKVIGVDMSKYGTLWEDVLPPRSTRPRTALEDRESLVMAALEGDKVHVVNPICLGASGKDVEWFVGALHEKGATVVIHDGARVFEPGDGLEELSKDVERMLHAYRVRKYRRGKGGAE